MDAKNGGKSTGKTNLNENFATRPMNEKVMWQPQRSSLSVSKEPQGGPKALSMQNRKGVETMGGLKNPPQEKNCFGKTGKSKLEGGQELSFQSSKNAPSGGEKHRTKDQEQVKVID